MKRKDKKNKGLLIVALILCITIGYAALTTTLNINGNSEIKSAKWDIHFANLVVDSASVEATTPATIDANKTTVSYAVNLAKPGDSYSFTVDVVNEGTIDGMISTVSNTGLTTQQQKYVEYSITYDDGTELQVKDGLKAGDKKNIKVSVKYKEDISPEDLPTEVETINLTFTVEYVQADETVITSSKKLISIKKQNEGEITVGDEVTIGEGETEQVFYVINSDDTKINMLAKYNLLVGQDYNRDSGEHSLIETNTAGYGLQNANAIGYKAGLSIIRGVVPFSGIGSSYWYYGNVFNNLYGTSTNYDNNIYSVAYTQSPKFRSDGNVTVGNYSVAYYVEGYINKLKEMGVDNVEGRLLLYKEAVSLGCEKDQSQDIGSCINAPYWVYNSTYWLGSADTGDYVFVMFSDGNFNLSTYLNTVSVGVRPVITILKSDI